MFMEAVQLSLMWILLMPRCVLATPSTVQYMQFTQNNAFNDIIRKPRIIQRLAARSRLHCFSRCSGSPACVSLFYNQEKHRCQLHDVIFITAANGQPARGTRYHVINHDGACSNQKGLLYGRSPEICFKIMTNSYRTWTGARTFCKKRRMRLITLNTAKKYHYVVRTMRHSSGINTAANYYIGLDDIRNNQRYVWSDGTTATWTNWYRRNPSNEKIYNCVMLAGLHEFKSKLQFVTRPCHLQGQYQFHFICERVLK